jgi:hypothetical protein
VPITDELNHISGIDIVGAYEIAFPGWFPIGPDVIVVEATLKGFGVILQ